mgnify:FL=1
MKKERRGTMKLVKCLAVALLIALPVTGGANAINTANARRHANTAAAASKAGDWATARTEWAQALVNAQLAGASSQHLAVFNYEYGRALGVQCFWDQSETYLLKAYELDRQAGGPEHMSLVELSRMKFNQKQYDRSAQYYRRAIEALEQINASAKAPAEFSVILDEYAEALRRCGKDQDADLVQARANEIRSRDPGGRSITDRTPYGTQCVTKDSK